MLFTISLRCPQTLYRHSEDVPEGYSKTFLSKGHIIVPGLHDAHAHILEYGATRQLDLEGSRSVQDVISRVKAYILSHPPVLSNTSTFIMGMGWDQSLFPPAKDGTFPFPTAVSASGVKR